MAAHTLSLLVRDVRDQVTRVKDALDSMAEAHGALYGRVEGRLDELIEKSEHKLAAVERALAEDQNGAQASAKLAEARNESKLLFRESFAFLEGAVSRQARLDDGFCELADKLLDALNESGRLNWRGLTILAETSFYGEVADVIRLKYPELSIWHLPVAVHEFGHFANPEIPVKIREGSFSDSNHPVRAILRREWRRDPKHWFHTHEFFADVFAIYAVGPAYAYSSVVLRPEPGSLRAESPNHPSWDERFFVIVETLQRIVSHGGASQAIVDDVADRWAGIRASGPGEKMPTAKKLRRLLDRFYPILDGHLGGVRYSTFARAQQLVPAIADDTQPLPPLRGVVMADVLNAAWLARIGDLDDAKRTATIEERAVQACQRI